MLIGLFMILLVSRRLLLSMNSNTKPENPDFMRVFGLDFFLWCSFGALFSKTVRTRWKMGDMTDRLDKLLLCLLVIKMKRHLAYMT